MAFIEFISVIYALVILVYIITLFRRPPNYPPGPRWMPFFGNSTQLKKYSKECGGQYLALDKWCDKYKSNVIGLKLGKDHVVFIRTFALVKEVLTSELFEFRPDNYFLKLRCLGKIRGVTCTNGDFWMEQRNFIAKELRNLGYGKITMDKMISDELKQIFGGFEKNASEIQLEPYFAQAVVNILWTLTTGKRIPNSDYRLKRFLDLMYDRSKAFDMVGGILGQLPWLRFVAPEYSGYNIIVKLNTEMKAFLMETVVEHRENWFPGRNDDFMYAFMTEMKKNEGRPTTTFTEEQLLVVCLDIFIAGSNTTSNTLDFIFLAMVRFPEIQEKVAKLLNSVLKSDKPIEYNDRLRVPYVEAVIFEIERFFCPIPTIGPRCVTKTTTVSGYTIPKGSTVLVSFHSLFKDPEYWGDPDVFRPERFLDENGEIQMHNRFIFFGLGRRRCLGDLLARHSIFLFFTEIIRKYQVRPLPGAGLPTDVPLSGIMLTPQKYKVQLIERSKIPNVAA